MRLDARLRLLFLGPVAVGMGLATSHCSSITTAASGTDPWDANTDGTGGGSGTDQNQVAGDFCASEDLSPVAEDLCYCEYTDCAGAEINCSCELACYGDQNCAVNCDQSGGTVDCTVNNGTVGSFVGDCGEYTCNQENDLSEIMTCSFQDCEPEVNVLEIETAPNLVQQTLEVERQITRADVLVTIDPSGSMQDEQNHMACAMDAFSNALSAEAQYSVGVMSQNTTCQEEPNGDMNGNIPPLIGLRDSSCQTTACQSCSTDANIKIDCRFTDAGVLVTESTANGLDILKKTMVIGEYRDEYTCDNDGNGDEASFSPAVLRALDAIERGQPAPAIVLAASDESADDDREACKWVERNHVSPNLDWFKRVLVGFALPALTGSCHQDLINFYAYFFSTYGCNHDPDGDGVINPEVPNPNPTTDPCTRVFSLCRPSTCDIQASVAEATGGAVRSINECPYDDFFEQIGLSTSTLSTAICGIHTADAGSLIVTHIEGGANTIVPPKPPGDANGWTYDENMGCINLHGIWAAVEGRFAVKFLATSTGAVPQLCFDPGVKPVLDSIAIHHQTADGPVIPSDVNQGWTFNPGTNCIHLHGTWANASGPFFVEYLD